MPLSDGWHRPNPIVEPTNDKILCTRCNRWCVPQSLHPCSAAGGRIVLVPA